MTLRGLMQVGWPSSLVGLVCMDLRLMGVGIYKPMGDGSELGCPTKAGSMTVSLLTHADISAAAAGRSSLSRD